MSSGWLFLNLLLRGDHFYWLECHWHLKWVGCAFVEFRLLIRLLKKSNIFWNMPNNVTWHWVHNNVKWKWRVSGESCELELWSVLCRWLRENRVTKANCSWDKKLTELIELGLPLVVLFITCLTIASDVFFFTGKRVVLTHCGSTCWLLTTGRNHCCMFLCLSCATWIQKSIGKP